ncbi:MAG: undecaprenyl-phosphate glucose phosphotransferase [Prevotella sp.]|nr:undecaprenyl-phosphate glucose phosphotransferase [Prevotella sp.]MCM1074314.1 undecaprenyl-phosphate glucose phosphotransferase [Ruminococcus sp.]
MSAVKSDNIQLGKYLQAILIIGDFAVINMAYMLVSLIPNLSLGFGNKLVWLVANVAFVPAVLLFSNIHKLRILFADRVVLQVFKSIVIYGLCMTVLFYILGIADVGWKAGFVFMGASFLLLSIWWLAAHKLLKKVRRMGLNFKRVIVVGAGANATTLTYEILQDPGYGYRIMGFFDDETQHLEKFSDYYTAPLHKIGEYVRKNKIDLIFYTLDAGDEEKLASTMKISDEQGIEFVYVPNFSPTLRGHFIQAMVGSLPVMTHTISPLTKHYNALLKRGFDLVFSIPVLLLSPLWALPIAIGIKLSSPGPILFKQKRTGIKGRDFTCYKFRTMKVNTQADSLQATENDPRKTRFGDFLRRSSLDELPQFLNVFLGNMSVVGPRPHMVSQTEDYSRLIDKYMVRHAVKPGISGWAQVNGYRGGTKHLWQMEKRVEYDVWYIHHWNIFLDIKIVFLTVFNAFRGESNAY